jgi:hypothetical protein
VLSLIAPVSYALAAVSAPIVLGVAPVRGMHPAAISQQCSAGHFAYPTAKAFDIAGLEIVRVRQWAAHPPINIRH